MKGYIGVKVINARPMKRIEYNDYRGWPMPENENGNEDGYLVEYVDGGQANTPHFDGYVSWSPKDVFDRAYRPLDGLTFGLAIEALKQGKYVQRSGWNGKGLKLALVGIDGAFDHSFAEVSNLPYIVIVYPADAINTPGAIVPWLASQTDMLAEDWLILE